jgi:hypothetical protein
MGNTHAKKRMLALGLVLQCVWEVTLLVATAHKTGGRQLSLQKFLMKGLMKVE